MPQRSLLFDRRLVGIWKSDKRMTLRYFSPPYGGTPKGVWLLRSLFGKLIVRWTRSCVYTDLEGFKSKETYEVVASGAESVVIRSFDELAQDDRLEQIHFEGKYYWVWAGTTREFFKRMPVNPRTRAKKNAPRGRSG